MNAIASLYCKSSPVKLMRFTHPPLQLTLGEARAETSITATMVHQVAINGKKGLDSPESIFIQWAIRLISSRLVPQCIYCLAMKHIPVGFG